MAVTVNVLPAASEVAEGVTVPFVIFLSTATVYFCVVGSALIINFLPVESVESNVIVILDSSLVVI